jgi:ABC-2 type transport system ATP-binding protein
MNAVETVNLTKVFDGKVAVDSATFTIQSGTIHGIFGANGAGKSTLLRMMIGLVQPTSGEIRVFGEPMHKEAKPLR